MPSLNLCIAGATGWTGSALVDAVNAAEDLELRSTVSRSAAGGEIGGAPAFATVAEALDGVDVLVDYTAHDIVFADTMPALEGGGGGVGAPAAAGCAPPRPPTAAAPPP